MCPLKSIKALCRAGAEAQFAGNAANAQFLLHQAYRRAELLQSPILEAKILNTMAVFLMEGKRPEKAVPLLVTAMAKVDGRIGRRNRLYSVISGNLLQAKMAAITKTALPA